MIRDLILRNRSYRRFYQDEVIPMQTLVDLVDLARLSASGGNIQPLKFILSCDPETNARIFPSLVWARYLTDWNGPAEGEKPTAYMVILGDTGIAKSFGVDHGIASQSILLGAAELGLGGCMIASVNRDSLRKELEIPEGLEILLVLALGRPREVVMVDAVGPDGNTKYWRDAQQVHHVPKRSLDALIIKKYAKD